MKIDASSFSLTRLVTFVPFYMLVNRTKLTILVSEEGQENWTEAKPEQVRTLGSWGVNPGGRRWGWNPGGRRWGVKTGR